MTTLRERAVALSRQIVDERELDDGARRIEAGSVFLFGFAGSPDAGGGAGDADEG